MLGALRSSLLRSLGGRGRGSGSGLLGLAAQAFLLLHPRALLGLPALLLLALAAGAQKRAGRAASEGIVQSYIHANGKIGALVEVDCETDFVARNGDFQEFARQVALHVAAARPEYVSEDEVPEERRQAELRIFEEQAQDKPENVRPKIAEGRLNKWLDEVVLLRQPHVNQDRYDGQTIEQLLGDLAASVKENVVIRRFDRFEVGEE